MAESMYQHIMNDFNLRPLQIKEHLEKVHHIKARQAKKGYERELWSSQHEFAHKNPDWQYKADEIIKEATMPQSGIFPDGTRVKMKSGSEGWVEGEVVEYFDLIPAVGGMIYGGGMTPGYKVRVLQGKHKGQILSMPMNYVEKASGSSVSTGGWHVEGNKWVKD
jgi:hypothetical protein